MSRILRICLFSVSTLAGSCTLAQQLSLPTRQTKYEYALRAGGHLYPTWRHGFLVAWEMDTSLSENKENLAVYDRDGRLVVQTRIWLEGASLVSITDAASDGDGRVAAVGWAVTSSGAIAGFLADVSTTQDSARIVQTSPFEPQAVNFGPDGTIWLLGVQVGPGRKLNTAPDHYMVQHFRTDDTLQDQHLLRSAFPCELAKEGNRERPQLLASNDRIGIFAPACRMWVELSTTGGLVGKWKWEEHISSAAGLEKFWVRSLALTSSDELYARLDLASSAGLFRFDRQSGSWLPVGASQPKIAGAPVLRLIGTDSNELVYVTIGQKVAWANFGKSE